MRTIHLVAAAAAIAVTVIAACAPPSPPPPGDAPPDDDEPAFADIDGTFVIDDVDAERPVTFHVPFDYDPANTYALMLLLAGYGVGGAQFDQAIGFGAFAERNDLVYAAPEGRVDPGGAHFWNASDACCDFARTGVDDGAFLAAVVNEARSLAHVDRVFVIGHSNGGFMAQRLACDHADVFDAVASIAGALPNDCDPSEPVAVLEAHGTFDDTIRYDGGSVDPSIPAYPSAPATASSWAALNGCDPGAVDDETALDLDVGVAGAETHASRFVSCDDGGAAELWTSEGGGHVPNGPPDYLDRLLGFLAAPR